MSTAVLEKKQEAPAKVEAPQTRRIAPPDVDGHGGWLLERVKEAYPHITDRSAVTFLRGLVFNNECLFLFQPNAVALAQVERAQTLSPTPIVRERFVFARAPEFIEEASWMYVEMERWAKSLGADTMLVCEGLSDVPPELISKRLNGRRVFIREQRFLKVG